MQRLANERKKYSNDYVFVRDWYGILGEKGARVSEHRLIASIILGRPLEEGEMVHHLDLDRSNNSPDNLVVVSSVEHGEFHRDGNKVRRQKPKKQVQFAGRSAYVKMRCPWCGKVFYRPKSQTVLVHDNKLHVNCCSGHCSNLLNDAVERGECHDLGRRARNNIVCEFNSNAAFMRRYVNNLLPSQWFIDDDGVFHGDA